MQKQVNRVGSFGIEQIFMVSHVWWAQQIENQECHLEFWYFRQKKNYKMMFMLRADGVSHPQMTTQVTIIS